MNTCKTCKRDDLAEINGMLANGTPLRNFANTHGISLSGIQRHKERCVDQGLFAEVREQRRAGLLSEVDKLKDEIATVKTDFVDNPNVRVQLIARHRDAIDLEAKLTGAYVKEAANPSDIRALAQEVTDRLVAQGVMTPEEARERVADLYPELVSKAVN